MRVPWPTFSLVFLLGVQALALVVPSSSALPKVSPNDCLFPCNQIIGTGHSYDSIPPIESPKFISASNFEQEYLNSNVLDQEILGVAVNGEARAYPLNILNYHEIVNDRFTASHLTVTYCPLTKSGIVYATASLGGGSTLGTTGRLYESNLVFYDRNTDTWWSQMLGVAIKGEKNVLGSVLPTYPAIQTTWEAWKTLYPSSLVLSRDTGFERDYGRNVYTEYQKSDTVVWPSSYDNTSAPHNLYPPKSHVFVLTMYKETHLYPFSELAKRSVANERFLEYRNPGFGQPTQTVANRSVVIFFDAENRLAMPFLAEVYNGLPLEFSKVGTQEYGFQSSETLGLSLFEDQTGSIWNMRGEAIAGSLKGEALKPLPGSGYVAFWFASSALFPNAHIFVTSDPSNSGNDGDGSTSDPSNDSEGTEKTNSSSDSHSSLTSETGFNYGASLFVSVILILTIRRLSSRRNNLEE